MPGANEWLGLCDTLGILTLIGLAVLAYANGANDVSRTVATLVGSHLASFRRGVLFGALFNALGVMAGGLLAQRMVLSFSAGIVNPSDGLSPAFALAIAGGAIAWVLLAVRLGLPVSTTHTIVGGLAGLGIVVFGLGGVRWNALIGKVVVPLLFSPALALAVACGMYLGLRCLAGRHTLKVAHWLSAAASSVARGLNDGPKIVALGALSQITIAHVPVTLPALFLLVATAMGLGGALMGWRVTRTLAFEVTELDELEGLAANFTTAGLVFVTGTWGLPVSTTHVITGAISGVGLKRGLGGLSWPRLRVIVFSWLVTLPASGLAALALYTLISMVIR